MSEEEALPPERDVKDFKFQQLCRFRISDSPSDLPKQKSRLVAASSQYGLAFVGYDTGFKVIRPAELSKIDQANAKERMTVIIDNFPVVADVKVAGAVSCIALNADELSLAVVVTRADQVQALIYDVRAFTGDVASVQSFLIVPLTKGGDARFEDLAWNPVQPNTLVTVDTNGGINLFNITDSLGLVATIPSSSANCVCWSPRGKQLVVGTSEGKLIQYDQELKMKREWPCPTVLTRGTYKVVGVIWLSTFEFLTAFISDDAETSDQPDIVLIRGSKDGPVNYQNFEDPCFGNGEERERRVLFQHLTRWEMILACSSNACEISVVGKHQSEQCDWERWNLDDSARAELPLTDNHEDTFPMGVAIDYSSQHPIPLGEGHHPSSPILLLLSTDGVLVPYYMMNMYSGAVVLTEPPKQLSSAGMRKLKGLETDAAGISSGQSSASTPTTGPLGPAGLSTGPSFLFVNPNAGATTKAAASPFGSPKTTTPSLFGTSPATSFGSSSSFSGFTTTKPSVGSTNATSTVAPAATFSFSQQSTASSTTKAATFSFSGSLGPQSQSAPSPGFSFGGNSTSSGGSTAFSFQTPASSATPVFGGPSTGSDKKTTSSFGGSTATKPAAVTTTAPTFAFGTTAPKSTASASTSGVSSVPASKTAGSSFANIARTPLNPPPVVQLSGATRPEQPPTQPNQNRQPSAFKGFVTSSQSPTAITTPQSTTGFKGFVNPTSSAALPNQIAQTAHFSQPALSQFGQAAGINQSASSQFSGKTPSLSVSKTPAASASVPQTPQTPQTAPVQTVKKVSDNNPAPAPVQVGVTPKSGDSEDTFTKGIMEELAHFEEEMSKFRAQTRNGGVLVGTRSEMHQLRGKVEELTNFSSGIITTTKDQAKEVDDQKSLCLDLFAMVEECRLRESCNTDNKYMHLLKARALDPASLDHLRQLQQQYQVLDQGLRDVDAILDQQWTEHQGRDRSRAKVKAPTTDVMYRVLKSNSTLIRNQKANLNNLEKKLKELKLYNKTSAWQYSSSSINESRDLELSSLADSLLEGDKKPEPSLSSTQIINKSASPEKQARLREHLARRAVPRIKSTRPENLSMSRIATVDRRRYDLEETVVAHAPEPTFQTNSGERGSMHTSTSQTAGSISTGLTGNVSGQRFVPPSLSQGKLAMTRQSGLWDISKQNMPPPSGSSKLPPTYTFNAVPGGGKNLGHIVVEDITPPSSTGYEEEDEEDDDDDDDDEEDTYDDDDDYEEDENGVGFGAQYSMMAQGDGALTGTFTPKAGGINTVQQQSGNLSKNLFGSPVAMKPASSNSASAASSAGSVLATFGSKPGEFSFLEGTQSKTSFMFGGNARGSAFGGNAGGSTKPETGFNTASVASASTTKPNQVAFSASTPKTSTVTSTKQTSFSFGGQSESSDKNVSIGNPLLLQALSEEDDTVIESPNSPAAAGFTFPKPVQQSNASGATKLDSGSSQEPAKTFGQSTSIGGSLFRVQSSSALSVGDNNQVPISSSAASLSMIGQRSTTNTSTVATGSTSPLSSTTSANTASAKSQSFGKTEAGIEVTSPEPDPKPDETSQPKISVSSIAQPESTTAGLFGKPGGLFGATPTTNSKEGLFGTATSTTSTGALCGTTSTTSTGGATSTTGTGGLFGTATSTTSTGGATSTTSTGGLFGTATSTTSTGGATSTTSTGGLFGTATSTTSTGGATSTTSTGGLFGTATSTTSTGGATSTTSTGGLFGTATSTTSTGGATSTTSTGGLFGTAASTTNTGGLFGTAPSTTSTGGLFGAPSTPSTGGLFGTAPSTSSIGGLFGTAPSTTSTGGSFGTAPSTTSTGGLFGTPSSTTNTGGLFGTPSSTTSTGSVFGTVPSTVSSGGLFGTATSTTSTGGLFGTATTTTSTGGLFGTATTTTSTGLFGTATTTTSTGGLFGTATSTTNTGGLFGTATTTTSAGGSFETAASSTTGGGGLFGGASAAKPLFGSAPSSTTSAPSLFGSTPKTTASTGFGGFTSPSFGQSAAFPQSNQSSTLFGQATTTQAGFGQSSSQNQASGDGGMFSGLGGQPSAEKANTNVFGSPSTFGTPAAPGSSTLFGSQKPGGFGTAGTSSPSGGAFSGGFSMGGSGVGSSGFGVTQPQTQGGFGGAPAFGGSPSFGSSTLGGFGSPPAFGGGATFGSAASFSSPVSTASPSPGGSGFAGFASSNSPTFGSLAGSSETPTFGTLGGGGGGGGFGSPGFGGGASPGFGSAPSQGFGNTGPANNSFGSNPAFSGYR
ncbi:nuclear pore complex protein Nup214-like isoform X2 [Argopecten irradians]|uniref:nuclear pore complex protein Nup214-like isoform X2 n=1 Tax=Argopecten irradians TaxID=31199 RepID=UPI00371AE1FD